MLLHRKIHVVCILPKLRPYRLKPNSSKRFKIKSVPRKNNTWHQKRPTTVHSAMHFVIAH